MSSVNWKTAIVIMVKTLKYGRRRKNHRTSVNSGKSYSA